MSYENEYTSISIRVPKKFREKYNETKEFWKDLGAFFVDTVDKITESDLDALKRHYPDVIQFIEDVLP